MNLKDITNTVVANAKEHSPEILIVAGVIGVVASAVMACKATTKIDTILDEHKDTMEKIHSIPTDISVYTEEDKKKDTAITYAKTGFKLVKLYGPSITLGVLSIAGIFASNDILRKRNVSLAAAYALVDKGFKEYRSRVVDRFGKDVDRQLLLNIKEEEVEETVVDAKGKEKTVKKKVEVADGVESEYVRYFTKSNPNWVNDENLVRYFLERVQSYVNDKLIVDKVMCLNDVYKELGFDTTKAGMVVGWIYDKNKPTGDNYIEFDVKEVWLHKDIGEGLEKAYAIDFNVDGNIFNLLNK